MADVTRVLVSHGANDAEEDLSCRRLSGFFALKLYLYGISGFPLIAGWMIAMESRARTARFCFSIDADWQ